MVLNKEIRCVVLGAGGHAKVVLDCLKTSGIALPHALLDNDPSLWRKEIFGVPVRGGDDQIDALKKEGVTHFIPGVGGIGDNGPRQRVFEWGLKQGLIPLTLQHPSAVISAWTTLGKGTVIFAGAIINPGSVIGNNCIINTGVIIDHDCVIEDHVHLATGVKLSGLIHVKQGAHIGTGASVRQSISIGEGAIVGAGSVVVKDVPPRTVVRGVPAR